MPGRFNIHQAGCMREGDVYLDPKTCQFKSGDLVIPVMGSTGAGKSTFINNVLDHLDPRSDKRAKAEDTMGSCTEKVAHYAVDLPEDILQRSREVRGRNRRLILVDTPGFGRIKPPSEEPGRGEGDEEVSRQIAVWLASSYGIGLEVAGVVYVHAIGVGRMSASHASGLGFVRAMCGEAAFGSVVFATTRSELCKQPDELTRRKNELRNNFWKDWLDGGATMYPLENTPHSAYEVVKTVIRRMSESDSPAGTVLLLQRQIVDDGRTYAETRVGCITTKRRGLSLIEKLVLMFRRLLRRPERENT